MTKTRHVRVSDNDFKALKKIQRERGARSINKTVSLIIEEWNPDYIKRLKRDIRDLKIENGTLERELNDEKDRSDFLVTEKQKLMDDLEEARINFNALRRSSGFLYRENIKLRTEAKLEPHGRTVEEAMAFDGMSIQKLISKVDSTKASIDACTLSLQDDYDHLARMQPPGVD